MHGLCTSECVGVCAGWDGKWVMLWSVCEAPGASYWPLGLLSASYYTHTHTKIHIHTQTSLPFALIYHLPGLKTRGKSETQRSVSLVWKICTSQSLKHFVLVYVWEMTKWTLRKWSQKVFEFSYDWLGTSVLKRQQAQTTVSFVFGYLTLWLDTVCLYG